MAEKKPPKEKQEHSFTADQLNWDQRVKSEMECAKNWNDNWGTLFEGGIPNDFEERAKYLAKELKSMPVDSAAIPKYGLGKAFKEVRMRDSRRKRMFRDPGEVAMEEEMKAEMAARGAGGGGGVGEH